MTLRAIVSGLAALVVASLLSGCTSAPLKSPQLSAHDLEGFSGVRAQLDSATGTMIFPLDKYEMTWAEQNTVDSANDVLMDRCLRKVGLSNPLLALDRSAEVQPENRTFGIWNGMLAAEYGYNLPLDPLREQGNALLSEQTQAWSDAQARCASTTHFLPGLRYDNSEALASGSVVAVGEAGFRQANTYVAAQREWKSIRSEWWSCLRNQGLTPLTASYEWTPKVPTDQTEAIKTALLDIQCKQGINMIQRLADLTARYQAAYVSKNEAALNAQRLEVEQVVKQANAILNNP